jgi:hypothetical protein
MLSFQIQQGQGAIVVVGAALLAVSQIQSLRQGVQRVSISRRYGWATTTPPARAWIRRHDAPTLDDLALVFPDLDALRKGRILPVWKQTVRLARHLQALLTSSPALSVGESRA